MPKTPTITFSSKESFKDIPVIKALPIKSKEFDFKSTKDIDDSKEK